MQHLISLVGDNLRRYVVYLLAVCCSLLYSCTEPAPISLSAEDRELVDTLYSRKVQVLRPRLDSLCEAIFDEEVQQAVDSMLVVRRTEEEQLRRRPAGEIEF